MNGAAHTTGTAPTPAAPAPGPRRADPWHGFQQTKSYDLLAAMPLFFWYCLAAGRLLPTVGQGAVALVRSPGVDLHLTVGVLAQAAALVLILMSMMFLLLRNPARAKASGLLPRFAAAVGTYLGVAVVWLPRSAMSTTQSFISLTLIVLGTAFTIYAMYHLGRSFSVMAEARHLVTDGPYARLRHPLYVGEAVSAIGLTIQFLSPLAVALTLVQLGFQLWRTVNEERVLAAQFPEYSAYAARTARLVPGVY